MKCLGGYRRGLEGICPFIQGPKRKRPAGCMGDLGNPGPSTRFCKQCFLFRKSKFIRSRTY